MRISICKFVVTDVSCLTTYYGFKPTQKKMLVTLYCRSVMTLKITCIKPVTGVRMPRNGMEVLYIFLSCYIFAVHPIHVQVCLLYCTTYCYLLLNLDLRVVFFVVCVTILYRVVGKVHPHVL